MRNAGHEPFHCWQPLEGSFALVGRSRDRIRSVLVLGKLTFEALEQCADDNGVHDERKIIVAALQKHLCEEGYLSEEDVENYTSEVSD